MLDFAAFTRRIAVSRHCRHIAVVSLEDALATASRGGTGLSNSVLITRALMLDDVAVAGFMPDDWAAARIARLSHGMDIMPPCLMMIARTYFPRLSCGR